LEIDFFLTLLLGDIIGQFATLCKRASCPVWCLRCRESRILKNSDQKSISITMQQKQLHIGCGNRYIPGMIHVDIRNFPHVDYVTGADKLYMFKDNSIDLIYCCHLLEHFRRSQMHLVLKEWYRVLKSGGTLRLAVPDFEKLVEVYSTTKDIRLVIGPIVGRQDFPENTHYMIFDLASLSELLIEVGFKNIHRYDWKQTIHRDYDDYSQAYLPHMDKENGILISLNLEAEK
jgi:predicted SAM-dependent methyltransferase